MPVILSERYITQEKNRENAIVTGTYKIAFHHRKTKLFKMCDFGWKKNQSQLCTGVEFQAMELVPVQVCAEGNTF